MVTYAAAAAGVSHALSGIAWSYSAHPTGGNLNGAGSVVFPLDIARGGPGFIPFAQSKKGSANTALVVTLAALRTPVSTFCDAEHCGS